MREFVFIIISSSLIFIALFNDSLKEYYEQTYHKNIEFKSGITDKLNELKSFLEYEVFFVKEKPQEIIEEKQNTIKETKIIYKPRCFISIFDSLKYYKKASRELILDKDNGVILLGDSLMQGVGIRICNHLRKEKIKCQNLAKQSTGLLRKKYYDYAKVLNESLKSSDIKNIVILVGVNDLWSTNNKGKVLKFGDLEWKKFYKTRIEELIKIAKKYEANMFWYELPVVKNNEQNTKVKVLNEIFYEFSSSYHLIKLNPVLTKHFDYYLKIDGKSKRIRSNDGIHFTPTGYELISQDFLNIVKL